MQPCVPALMCMAHAHVQVGRMVLCDRCGTRMPAVRATVDAKIGQVYKGLDLTLECHPADDVEDDPEAFRKVGRWKLRGCHSSRVGFGGAGAGTGGLGSGG